jgi:hypothetical protein
MSCQQYSEDNNNDSVTIVAEIVENFEEGENSCPICMDDIDINKNCIVTECGHKFHCSCLMKNAATNGFGCPMCRTVMAEQLADDDSDEYTSEYDEDEEEEEMFDDNALTSFRMLYQQIEGEEVEEEPEYDFEDVDEDAEDAELVPAMPTPETIAARLAARGITLEDAVKVLLLEHGEYTQFEEVYDRRAQEIYGQIRRIIHQSTFQAV